MIIPIVFSTDDNYVLPLCVSIKSLLNNKNLADQYKIYVFYSELKLESKDLVKLVVGDDAEIDFVCVNQYLSGAKLYETGHFSIAMYYRFLASKILSQYEKILYLDCDIIIQKDISKLFNINLDNVSFAAVPHLYFKGKKDINSGVMLINTKEFNENNISDKCIQYINDNQSLRLPDQDALNAICGKLKIGGIKLIGVEYNFNPKYYSTPWALSNKELLKIDEITIIHYAFKEKPWKSKMYMLNEKWWEVVEELPDLIKQKIKALYLDNIDEKKVRSKYLEYAFGNWYQRLIFRTRRFLYKIKNLHKKRGDLI